MSLIQQHQTLADADSGGEKHSGWIFQQDKDMNIEDD